MANATETTSPLQHGIKETSEHQRGRLPDLPQMRAPVAAVDPGRQHQAVQLRSLGTAGGG
jgi:hypothetical protein